MKDNISIGMMVGIVIVVAIVTSFVTTSFTGKAILSNTADSVNPMTVKSSNWLQAIFKGTGSAGGIGLNSSDNKQFEIQSVQAGGISGTSKSGLIIYDRNANQYRQVITSDGNVGIGTTNPQAKLYVNGDIKANGKVRIPFSEGGASGETQLSATGFFQNFSESIGSGSIEIGGDNMIMKTTTTSSGRNLTTSRQTTLSPASIYFDENNGVFSSRLTHEYLQFCSQGSCIFCYPNFVTKTLDCR